jgi:hypothetical protein
MEFVKKNLFLIICGVVVLLALVALWWPLGSYADSLRADMTDRLGQVTAAQHLITPIRIAANSIGNYPVIQEVIDKRKEITAQMKDQTAQISSMAAEKNQVGRVTQRDGRLVALIGGQVADTDAYHFKSQYGDVFPRWLTQLTDIRRPALDTIGTLPPLKQLQDGAQPPLATDIQKLWDDRQADIRAREGNVPGAVQNGNGQQSGGTPDPQFVRDQVNARANGILMYVDAGAFHRLAFLDGPAAPDENQMASALVESWVGQDVVNAIAATNTGANVNENVIKRLKSVVVGSGSLFASGTPNASGLDPSKSMTGRVNNDRFYVSNVTITIVATPTAVNQFINSLYLQSNAYTVLNVSEATVDPFEAAGNGYIYGSTDVVTATITTEALFFKDWTTSIFPPTFAATAGGGAPAGQPGFGQPTPGQDQGDR